MSGLEYYRIVVLTKSDKMVDKEFIVGKVEEKINGKWVRILCLR